MSRPPSVRSLSMALACALLCSGAASARHVDVQAHRGGRGLAPESSLAAFRASLALRVPTLELDLQATPDGELYVAHDPGFDAARAPRFGAVLDLVRQAPYPARVSAEIKRQRPVPGMGPRELAGLVLAALDAHDMRQRAIVQSFDADVLAATRDMAPDVATSMLVRDADEADAALDRSRATILSPRADGLRPRHVERAHARGVDVIPWVVNDPARARELVSWGVDGIITDRPDVVGAAIGAPLGTPLGTPPEEPQRAASDEGADEDAPAAAPPGPAWPPREPGARPLELRDIHTVAVAPFTSGGNVDTFCTSLFVQEARRRRAFREILDPYELSVTTPDGQPFHPQSVLSGLLDEARAKGADALLVGEGKWYDWGFRMEWRLIEVQAGRVAWSCAKASGFTFSGPSAKKELQREAVSHLLRSRK